MKPLTPVYLHRNVSGFVTVTEEDFRRTNHLLNMFERFVCLVTANEGECYSDWMGDWSEDEKKILAEIGAV